MKAIISLQNLIKEEEKRIAFAKKQLSDHESGVNRLTFVVKASTETSLEDATELLTKHKLMIDELMKQDIKELEEQERIEAAIIRKNYYNYQKIRLKRDKQSSNDQKVAAMLILDELPEDIHFEDNELLEVAVKSIELDLAVHEEIEKDLINIRGEYESLTKDLQGEDILDLGMLSQHIPIVALHFSVLLANIKENIEKENLAPFHGFPNFEDWWIEELWASHQAYIGLYKWKSIIHRQCNTSDQERAWEVIFSNWLFIKQLLNKKGSLGFKLNFCFDTLIQKYGEIEEELSTDNILSLDEIVIKLTKEEDFSSVSKTHNPITNYMEFKKEKLKR